MPPKQFVKSRPSPAITQLPVLGMDKADFVADFKQYYIHVLGRDEDCRSPFYAFAALSYAIRDRLMERWKATHATYKQAGGKRMFYLSMEYLLGRALGNAMLNLGITGTVDAALGDLGVELEELLDSEHDAGLGNGGLGRLAACFIDSCATLQLPVIGYGLRYEYGMFTQAIVNGEQVEKPDHWLRHGNVWEIERLEYTHTVKFGGHTEALADGQGGQRRRWANTYDVLAVPYDLPVPGYRNNTVNTLRLWKAVATEEFNLEEFNAGDYEESVAAKITAEHITMVLYPNDANDNGKALRLRQQYFLASASLQDVISHWVKLHGGDFSQFADKNCFQLNDTHPSIAIPELMRLLMDEHGLGWDGAWAITCRCMAYTNHTLLPEALEKWPLGLVQRLLPRPMEIIFEINARFLSEVAGRWPGDTDRLRRMSIIEEGADKQVRMAHLAIVGSFSVNGVAKLHSQLLRQGLFKDFHAFWPEKFNNKTNGISPRRWLAGCNPELSALITEAIGEGWATDLAELERLTAFAGDAEFRRRWRAVKQRAKGRLIDYKQRLHGDVHMGCEALFAVQVKRIHEYKRQTLNLLHVIHLYDRIKRGDGHGIVPRCVLIGGKAAPGYAMAKKIIKLINNVAQVINGSADLNNKLALVFLADYRVSAMEMICPAADLSEQLSTAGKEASGTGNMKLMMNGALTIGTYDGANIEIRDEVGADNFFLFGLNEQEAEALRPRYDPAALIGQDEDLRRVLWLLESGHFNQFEPGLFDGLLAALKSPHDPWLTLADFRGYLEAQRAVEAAYQDSGRWTAMSILNTAKSGRFSSDRTIGEYNRDIWRLTPWPVNFDPAPPAGHPQVRTLVGSRG